MEIVGIASSTSAELQNGPHCHRMLSILLRTSFTAPSCSILCLATALVILRNDNVIPPAYNHNAVFESKGRHCTFSTILQVVTLSLSSACVVSSLTVISKHCFFFQLITILVPGSFSKATSGNATFKSFRVPVRRRSSFVPF